MVTAPYGWEGVERLVLLAQVRQHKVEGCLVVRRETHDLDEVHWMVLNVADIQPVKVTTDNELCRLVSHPESIGSAYRVLY